MPSLYSFNKKEKLKSRKQIEALFAEGKFFTIFPLKIFYLLKENDSNFDAKTGVGVGKRYFRKAVERNRIKRLLREAYRTEKLPLHQFLKNHNIELTLFIMYIDKTLPLFSIIKKEMQVVIQKLIKQLDENLTQHI
jgi:ribonuclease P protein component